MSEVFDETTANLGFWVDHQIHSLEELRDYILERAVAPPISCEELVAARVVTLDQIALDELPEENEFTLAEATYLGRVIDFCVERPELAIQTINLDDTEEGTEVLIRFPEHLEPPAELI